MSENGAPANDPTFLAEPLCEDSGSAYNPYYLEAVAAYPSLANPAEMGDVITQGGVPNDC